MSGIKEAQIPTQDLREIDSRSWSNARLKETVTIGNQRYYVPLSPEERSTLTLDLETRYIHTVRTEIADITRQVSGLTAKDKIYKRRKGDIRVRDRVRAGVATAGQLLFPLSGRIFSSASDLRGIADSPGTLGVGAAAVVDIVQIPVLVTVASIGPEFILPAKIAYNTTAHAAGTVISRVVHN